MDDNELKAIVEVEIDSESAIKQADLTQKSLEDILKDIQIGIKLDDKNSINTGLQAIYKEMDNIQRRVGRTGLGNVIPEESWRRFDLLNEAAIRLEDILANIKDEQEDIIDDVQEYNSETRISVGLFRSIKNDFSDVVKSSKSLVLGLIGARSAYSAIRKAMSSYLAQNTELQQKINACWYALGSLFAPALEFIVSIFVRLVSFVDAFAKALGFAGINMAKYGSAASKTSKQLASFDEINNVSEQSGGAGSNPFGIEALGDKWKTFMSVVEANAEALKLVGLGAMFGIGTALLFTGHVGMGLGLILASGVLAYNYLSENWDYVIGKVGGAKNALMLALGGFEFGLGAILLFTGHIVEGLGLMGIGIGTTAMSLNWDTLPKKIGQTLQKISIYALMSTAAIGAIALFVGAAMGSADLMLTGLLMLIGGVGTLAYGTSSGKIDWNVLSDDIGDALDNTNKTAITGVGNLQKTFKNGYMGINNDMTVSLATMSSLNSGKFSEIEQMARNWVKGIATSISNGWNNMITSISNACNNMKTTISNAFTNMVNSINTGLNNAKNYVSNAWDDIKTDTTNKWESIKNSINNVWNTIKNIFSGTSLSDNISKAWANVSSIFDSNSSISKGIISKIKSFFSNIETYIYPNVQMPEFTYTNANGKYQPARTGTQTIAIPKRYDVMYAEGTNYVPNDQLAFLHKGEAVIPAEYNNAIQGSPFNNGGQETNTLLRELINVVDSKEFRAYISQNEIGKTAVNYINNQSRILGGSVI